ncbi:MAG: SDR family NAD(P)-dependent oxidoreductase [Pseudomonadales bacterium]|jgi:NAD(P)-dependent dehydrogenase (short-subunit alcohol dehydrogenase family)|nr:SDR family NAD(P)-dependent oxidoreductase [Pseudomonadales bacterium]
MGEAFSRESTTADVLAGIDLSGTTMLVTGANSGLGLETARALGAAGAKVVISTRSQEKSTEALATLSTAVPDAILESVEMDLGSLASVRAAADTVLARYPRLDVVIGNAGVMNTPLGRTEDGFETQFGVDHLGHFLFYNRIAPSLLSAAPARIVMLSSGAHFNSDVLWDDVNWARTEYDKFLAYGQAKTANALCAVAMNARLQRRGVRAFSVHPGVIETNLGRYMTAEDRTELIARMIKRMGGDPADVENMDLGSLPMFIKSVEQGAATSCWAATAASLDAYGGRYLADCRVAPVVESYQPDGCMAYALDPDAAERLWRLSEEMIGERFEY